MESVSSNGCLSVSLSMLQNIGKQAKSSNSAHAGRNTVTKFSTFVVSRDVSYGDKIRALIRLCKKS